MTIYATPVSEPRNVKGKNEKMSWDFYSYKFVFHDGTLPTSITELAKMPRAIQCNTDRGDLEEGKDYILKASSITSTKNEKGYWGPGLGSLEFEDE